MLGTKHYIVELSSNEGIVWISDENIKQFSLLDLSSQNRSNLDTR
jgi:hypothetical protein